VKQHASKFLELMPKMYPTEVSHLDVVVGLCSDDPKRFLLSGG